MTTTHAAEVADGAEAAEGGGGGDPTPPRTPVGTGEGAAVGWEEGAQSVVLLGGMRLPAPRPSHAGLATILLTTLLTAGVAEDCGLDECTDAFLSGRDAGVAEGANLAYCSLVHRYVQCTAAHSGQCKGNIHYHSVERMLASYMELFNCTEILAQETAPQANLDASGGLGPTPTEGQDVCRYLGSDVPAHCGLFGDPHLKTFTGSYMTCSVEGAWPLLNTPYLAIQVTNEPVGPAHHATATTKVTIIIKGHEVCGDEKTYEASTEALPKAFVDGTTWSGGSALHPHIQVQEKLPGEHILITVSYINASIAVRKIRRYLTVLVTLPESLLGELDNYDELQLCLQGCPSNERLDRAGTIPVSLSAMNKDKAAALCKEYNVTDYYLDFCIFDLVTTGDESFRIAAQAAQKDLWEHDPVGAQRLLLNCSEPPCVWKITSLAQYPYPSRAMIILALFLFAMTMRAIR